MSTLRILTFFISSTLRLSIHGKTGTNHNSCYKIIFFAKKLHSL